MYWLNSICWVGFQLPLNESIEADSDLVRGEVGQSILTKVERVNAGIGLWDHFELFLFFVLQTCPLCSLIRSTFDLQMPDR